MEGLLVVEAHLGSRSSIHYLDNDLTADLPVHPKQCDTWNSCIAGLLATAAAAAAAAEEAYYMGNEQDPGRQEDPEHMALILQPSPQAQVSIPTIRTMATLQSRGSHPSNCPVGNSKKELHC